MNFSKHSLLLQLLVSADNELLEFDHIRGALVPMCGYLTWLYAKIQDIYFEFY